MINKMIDIILFSSLLTLCSVIIFSPVATGMQVVLMFLVAWYTLGQGTFTSHKLTNRQYIVRTMMLCGPISILFLVIKFIFVRTRNDNKIS